MLKIKGILFHRKTMNCHAFPPSQFMIKSYVQLFQCKEFSLFNSYWFGDGRTDETEIHIMNALTNTFISKEHEMWVKICSSRALHIILYTSITQFTNCRTETDQLRNQKRSASFWSVNICSNTSASFFQFIFYTFMIHLLLHGALWFWWISSLVNDVKTITVC